MKELVKVAQGGGRYPIPGKSGSKWMRFYNVVKNVSSLWSDSNRWPLKISPSSNYSMVLWWKWISLPHRSRISPMKSQSANCNMLHQDVLMMWHGKWRLCQGKSYLISAVPDSGTWSVLLNKQNLWYVLCIFLAFTFYSQTIPRTRQELTWARSHQQQSLGATSYFCRTRLLNVTSMVYSTSAVHICPQHTSTTPTHLVLKRNRLCNKNIFLQGDSD